MWQKSNGVLEFWGDRVITKPQQSETSPEFYLLNES
jgi:hypothetical protein